MRLLRGKNGPNCPAVAPKTAPQGQKRPDLPRGGSKDCIPGAKTGLIAPRWPQRLHLRGKNGLICPAEAPTTASQGQKRAKLPRGGPNDCTPGAKIAQIAPRRSQRLFPRGKNGLICPAVAPKTASQGQRQAFYGPLHGARKMPVRSRHAWLSVAAVPGSWLSVAAVPGSTKVWWPDGRQTASFLLELL